MRAILAAYLELWRAIGAGFRSPRVLALLSLSAMIAASGALVLMRLEGWAFIDALYFCVVSMATVGYGDFAPLTTMGKIFTMAYLILAIGLFVLTVTTLAESIISEFRTRRAKD